MSKSRRMRGRGRRGFRKLLACLLVISVLLIGISLFLRIENIEVVGSSKYSADDIVQTSGIKIGGGMYTFNKFKSIDSIKKEFPYVESVLIRRRLPSTIVITVEEAVPVAVLQSGNSYWLINSDADILESTDAQTAAQYTSVYGVQLVSQENSDIPVVSEESDLNYKQLKKILKNLSETEITTGVTSIDVSSATSLSMCYENRITVQLGDGNEIEYRITYFEKILQELDEADRGTIYFTEAKTARFSPE